ncbi:GNAT family N-acetyltransferase [Actinotalea sp. BY-33]|uniref:GNAT family N-acetyltransferase n=1 Tax=Actinotalea soli TaxID=2819234 RepID=A0A939LNI7_9CELL|nr:GNAT family N-acetyltransferase [Actinotalea soli]MBO1750749.1 GNAT family N-acetyltransferase [Actinotalea soli]
MVDDLTDMVIRPATDDDARAIAEVHVASWRQAYTGVIDEDYLAKLDVSARAAWWSELLDSSNTSTSVWVAENEGRVVGFASMGPSLDEDADRSALQIYTIYLDPSAWGHGIARELMRTVLADVPEGVPVTLWVPAANERARHFYRRHGFSADGVERVEEFGGDQLREMRYRKG